MIFFTFLLLFFFDDNASAQCSITKSTNTTGLLCGTAPLSNCGGILYIGDGTNAMTLTMTTNLDLTCLGAIRFIIRNKALVDFSNNNYDLKLAAGSSIEIEKGEKIGAEDNCSNSDLITIGNVKIASCQGGGGLISFPTLVDNGGYNIVKVTPESASSCGPGDFSFTATAFPSSGATIKWYTDATAVTAVKTGAVNSGTDTFAPTTLSATTTYYAEASYNGYTTPRKAVTATVNIIPEVPTVGPSIQPDCDNSKGSVTLDGLRIGAVLEQTGTIPNRYDITKATMTISALVPGTYNFKVNNGPCSSGSTRNVVINPVLENIWNGSAWSRGTNPTLSDIIIFTGDYPPVSDPNVDLEGCSCKVSGTAIVTIKEGRTLTIKNEVDVQPNAKLTFENNASLVKVNEDSTINSGEIIYKRITPSLIETDYTYWSSPVSGQTLNISSDYAYGSFYSYDSVAVDWAPESLSTAMSPGKGYIIRGQKSDNSIYNVTASSKGVPNNGFLTTPIGVAGKSNLIGNPYPSALDFDKFYDANQGLIEGTIYFWTHNTAIQLATNIDPGKAGSGIYAYTSDDYAVYNLTGGISAIPIGGTKAPSGTSSNNNIPSGKIASGQAFFTTSLNAGNAVFNNSMRVGGGKAPGNNSQFFKNASNYKAAEVIQKNRVWLNLTNTQGAFKQTLVGYITGATNDFDNGYDRGSFDGNEFIDFYSVNYDKSLVIQGRALPFQESDTIYLGYRSAIAGDFTISIDQVDGLFECKEIYLIDNMTNSVHNLNELAYDFKTEMGTFNDRFVLSYVTGKNLATDDLAVVEQGGFSCS